MPLEPPSHHYDYFARDRKIFGYTCSASERGLLQGSDEGTRKKNVDADNALTDVSVVAKALSQALHYFCSTGYLSAVPVYLPVQIPTEIGSVYIISRTYRSSACFYTLYLCFSQSASSRDKSLSNACQ